VPAPVYDYKKIWYYVDPNGYPHCKLCNKQATEDHVNSFKHIDRVKEFPSWLHQNGYDSVTGEVREASLCHHGATWTTWRLRRRAKGKARATRRLRMGGGGGQASVPSSSSSLCWEGQPWQPWAKLQEGNGEGKSDPKTPQQDQTFVTQWGNWETPQEGQGSESKPKTVQEGQGGERSWHQAPGKPKTQQEGQGGESSWCQADWNDGWQHQS